MAPHPTLCVRFLASMENGLTGVRYLKCLNKLKLNHLFVTEKFQTSTYIYIFFTPISTITMHVNKPLTKGK